MPERCFNRLTAAGPADLVERFVADPSWEPSLAARFSEFLDHWEGRYVRMFETDGPPLDGLKALSIQWPGLTLILDYGFEESAIKGLAMVRDGKLQHCQFTY